MNVFAIRSIMVCKQLLFWCSYGVTIIAYNTINDISIDMDMYIISFDIHTYVVGLCDNGKTYISIMPIMHYKIK